MIEQALRMLSSRIRRKAKSRSVNYSFFVHAGKWRALSEITSLNDAGVIRPVMDRIFPFASTNEAIAYVEAGRAKRQGRRQGKMK
jgi:alcohol dehydrogenase